MTQEPTRKDVQSMAEVLRDVGELELSRCTIKTHRFWSGDPPGPDQPGNEQPEAAADQTGAAQRRQLLPALSHQVPPPSSLSLSRLGSHGTEDNFLQDKDGAKTWNIESLITEVSIM